eukprot:TRINITY_DN6771_c0_g1_i1.p1 TRINITY_DN6771_c0_g1~~TRINITY_DN6771_c0_g1_i1.p1  ORF type:complete len:1285 (+),score=316.72 TRINITY_DN6771_c0_g1_i1:75-3857(+)
MPPAPGAAAYLAACGRHGIDSSADIISMLSEPVVECALAEQRQLTLPESAALQQGLLSSQAVGSIDLDGAGFGQEGAELLAQVMLRHAATLEVVRVTSCNIGSEGAKAIATGAAGAAVLHTLDLQGNAIGSDGMASLGRALELNSTLTELTLTENSADDAAAAALARGVATHPCLRTLNLRFNAVCDAGATALAVALPRARSLAALDLGGNHVSASGAMALAHAVSAGDSPSRLRKLNLRSNAAGDAGAAALCAATGRDGAEIEGLYLGFNRLSPQGAAAALRELRSARQLRKLDMQGVLLGGDGEAELAALISGLPALEQLVADLALTPRAGAAAADACLRCLTFEEVTLGLPQDSDVEAVLRGCAEGNALLRQLTSVETADGAAARVAVRAARAAMSLLPYSAERAAACLRELEEQRLLLQRSLGSVARPPPPAAPSPAIQPPPPPASPQPLLPALPPPPPASPPKQPLRGSPPTRPTAAAAAASPLRRPASPPPAAASAPVTPSPVRAPTALARSPRPSTAPGAPVSPSGTAALEVRLSRMETGIAAQLKDIADTIENLQRAVEGTRSETRRRCDEMQAATAAAVADAAAGGGVSELSGRVEALAGRLAGVVRDCADLRHSQEELRVEQRKTADAAPLQREAAARAATQQLTGPIQHLEADLGDTRKQVDELSRARRADGDRFAAAMSDMQQRLADAEARIAAAERRAAAPPATPAADAVRPICDEVAHLSAALGEACSRAAASEAQQTDLLHRMTRLEESHRRGQADALARERLLEQRVADAREETARSAAELQEQIARSGAAAAAAAAAASSTTTEADIALAARVAAADAAARRCSEDTAALRRMLVGGDGGGGLLDPLRHGLAAVRRDAAEHRQLITDLQEELRAGSRSAPAAPLPTGPQQELLALQAQALSLSDTVQELQTERSAVRQELAAEVALLRQQAGEAQRLSQELARRLAQRGGILPGDGGQQLLQLSSRMDRLEEVLRRDQQASLAALEALLNERHGAPRPPPSRLDSALQSSLHSAVNGAAGGTPAGGRCAATAQRRAATPPPASQFALRGEVWRAGGQFPEDSSHSTDPAPCRGAVGVASAGSRAPAAPPSVSELQEQAAAAEQLSPIRARRSSGGTRPAAGRRSAGGPPRRPPQEEALRGIFASFARLDRSSTGSAPRADLLRALDEALPPEDWADRLRARVDNDRTDTVTWSEFEAHVRTCLPPPEREGAGAQQQQQPGLDVRPHTFYAAPPSRSSSRRRSN